MLTFNHDIIQIFISAKIQHFELLLSSGHEVLINRRREKCVGPSSCDCRRLPRHDRTFVNQWECCSVGTEPAEEIVCECSHVLMSTDQHSSVTRTSGFNCGVAGPIERGWFQSQSVLGDLWRDRPPGLDGAVRCG
jgi:hypothetical protein